MPIFKVGKVASIKTCSGLRGIKNEAPMQLLGNYDIIIRDIVITKIKS